MTRTENSLVLIDDPLLQSGHGGNDLIGGGRGVFALDGLVVQGAVRILDQGAPFLGAQTGNEVVLIEGRAAGQGQDFAGVRVQGDRGPGLVH